MAARPAVVWEVVADWRRVERGMFKSLVRTGNFLLGAVSAALGMILLDTKAAAKASS